MNIEIISVVTDIVKTLSAVATFYVALLAYRMAKEKDQSSKKNTNNQKIKKTAKHGGRGVITQGINKIKSMKTTIKKNLFFLAQHTQYKEKNSTGYRNIKKQKSAKVDLRKKTFSVLTN
jgi:DNA polymerase III gamma/tau subunit